MFFETYVESFANLRPFFMSLCACITLVYLLFKVANTKIANVLGAALKEVMDWISYHYKLKKPPHPWIEKSAEICFSFSMFLFSVYFFMIGMLVQILLIIRLWQDDIDLARLILGICCMGFYIACGRIYYSFARYGIDNDKNVS